MSRIKNLIQMIQSFNKNEFDDTVRSYLKEIYGYTKIVVTDGKDDLGHDIRVFDLDGLKMQYQITIMKSGNTTEQNNLKKKIFDDVEKAKSNHDNFGYGNNLYFFYSYVLTEKVKSNYKREALTSYKINLEIIDANQIAYESEEYIELQKIIYRDSGYEEFKSKKEQSENKQQCLIYDLLSFGKAADVKLSIVECYIQQCLYEKGALTLSELSNMCMDKFNSNENDTFYNKLVYRMSSTDKVLIYSKEEKKYNLSNEKKKEIERGTEQILIDERYFVSEITTLLKRYNQEEHFDIYYKKLYELYVNNFNKRINLSEDIDNIELNVITNFAKKKLGSLEKAQELISNVLIICDKNKYLQKKCASAIFSGQFDINKLQKHAESNKRVFIDTTIALHLLCYFYEKSDNYDNYYYELSVSIEEFCKKRKIKLYITERYLWEIETHIKEALNLEPFTTLPTFSSLGGSRNVFYNYYLFLKKKNIRVCSFGEFLDQLDFKRSYSSKTIEQYISNYLNNLNINIISVSKKYDINETRKLIENELIISGRNKSPFGLANDAIMLEFLADTDVVIHPVDPIFITWDKTLFKIHNMFFKTNPRAQRWMQFTPSQFIDRYSLLSLSINEETISKEMLAMLSGSIIQNTHSLLDSLSLIVNPKDETGIEYLKRFSEMRDSNIYMTNKTSDAVPEDTDINILDNIVFSIMTHYSNDEKRMDSLKNLFTQMNYVDKVMNAISENIKYYTEHKRIDEDIFKHFDEMMKEI